MKRLVSLFLIFSLLLCGCATGRSGSAPQSSSVVENSSSAPQSSSVVENSSSAPRSSSVSDSSSQNIENRWLTAEELNEVNKVFAYKTSGEYPEIRALLGNSSDYPVLAVKVLVKKVAERLCGDAYNDKFLDNANQYLTAEDAEEIEFLKNLGYDLEYDKISSGQLKYARITYEALDSYLKKYMGISCADTSPESWNDNGYVINGRQYGYGTKCVYVPENKTMYCKKDYEVPQGSFLCVSGRIQGDKVLLYSENPREEILTLKKTEDSYIVSSIHDNNINPVNTYEENGMYVYDFMYRPKDIFLAKDSTKGVAYNRAIDCFNRQLQKESENWHYPQWGEEYISGYRLYDFEKDGVPEMITRHGMPVTLATYVYSYVDGKLVKDYLPDGVILSNGMIGYYRVGTYDRYTLYKHNPDGTFEKALELEEVHTSPETENDFYINEVQVTEAEYHKTGDYYIAEYEKAAYPPYSLFYEEIVY